MKNYVLIILISWISIAIQAQPVRSEPYAVLEFNVGTTLNQARMAPVNINGQKHMLLIYSEEQNVDPYEDNIIFPDYTVKIALYDVKGNFKWKKELPNVIPGTWFLPVMPFDLNSDGTTEIFLVNTTDGRRPLNKKAYILQQLDPVTGEETGNMPWPWANELESLSHRWRFFIVGGYVNNTPVLMTVQGTYEEIRMQAWNADMSSRWKKVIPNKVGPRGSHWAPIIDTDKDGVEEVLIGERCIEFDKGEELFIMDGMTWTNHSDVVQPVWDNKTNKWFYWTCREKPSLTTPQPRAVFFDEKGNKVWAIKETTGHFHRGWLANIGPKGEKIAMAARYKTTSVSGYDHWTFDAFTGKEVSVPFDPLGFPLDFNGDGIHEILVGSDIVDNKGEKWGSIGKEGRFITLNKLTDLPGEQILAYYPDGTIKLWAAKNAQETPEAQRAFESRYYQRNRQMTGVGYMNRFLINCY